MCRPVSFRARAIGASIRRPARLREWKPAPAPNGAAPIWLMVRDTGYSRSSQKKSFGCCCESSADREEGTLPLWVKRVGPAVSACRLHLRLRTYRCKATNRRFGPIATVSQTVSAVAIETAHKDDECWFRRECATRCASLVPFRDHAHEALLSSVPIGLTHRVLKTQNAKLLCIERSQQTRRID